MTKSIPQVDKLTATFETFIDRTNLIIDAVSSEVITANSTMADTGTPDVQLNARLWGSLTTNTVIAYNGLNISTGSFAANTSRVVFNVPIQANNSVGAAGQILTSNGSGVYWSSAIGTGTLTLIDTPSASGLLGGPITESGSLSVRPGAGITVNANGVSVNATWLATQSIGNAAQLLNKTWNSPGEIGLTVANTGNFSTLKANNSITIGAAPVVFYADATNVLSIGYMDATTPSGGTIGGVRVRSNVAGSSRIQFTNNLASSNFGTLTANSSGILQWTGEISMSGIDVGYKNVPQEIASTSNIQSDTKGGRHFYLPSAAPANVTMTILDNTVLPCVIGTAITIVNGSATKTITIAQSGATLIQLAGTSTTGNRVIGAGGVATILKVESNKWFISGIGVT